MSVLDLSLVKAPYGTGPTGPATIDGWAFDIDPSSVELPIRAKVQKFQTVGGFVVQVYGTTWGDLTVSGQFGVGGWQAQQAFLERMMALAQNQAMQRTPTYAGQNFTPSQPFPFHYPLLGWKFLCFLKGYTSSDGAQAVHLENTNINPKWTLTLFVVTDNGSLLDVTKTAYLQRLAPGLGMMWDSGTEGWQGYSQDQYNAPGGNVGLQGYINDPSQRDVVTVGGASTTADSNGQGSGAGASGKSVTPPDVSKIKTPNDFSVCLLSELGIVTTDASSPIKVGSAKATNDVRMLNAQQQQEGMWGNPVGSQRYAGTTHNPLNINAPSSPGFVNIGGTDTFDTWQDGLTATVNTYNGNFVNAAGGLLASNFTQWMNGLQVHYSGPGPWAGGTNSSDSVDYASWQGYHSSIHKIYAGYGGTDPDNVVMP